MILYKLDEYGFMVFGEELIVDDGVVKEGYTSIPLPTDVDGNQLPFYKPKLEGEHWVEGGTIPSPAEPEPSESDYIMLAIADLDIQRAKDKTQTELAITELAELLLGGI